MWVGDEIGEVKYSWIFLRRATIHHHDLGGSGHAQEAVCIFWHDDWDLACFGIYV